MQRKRGFFVSAKLPLVFIALWCVLSYGKIVPPLFLPTPTAVLSAGLRMFLVENFQIDVLLSVLRLISGFVLSVAMALPLGLMIGVSSRAEAAVAPSLAFVRYLPPTAFIPLAVLWLGVGFLQNIALVWLSVFFYLTLLVADSATAVRRTLVDTALTLGASRAQVTSRVVLPAALPQIWNSMRTMWGVGWTMLVVVEIAGADSGIGAKIIRAQRFLQTPKVLAGIAIIGLIGLISDLAFRAGGKKFFPWSQEFRVNRKI
jgi:NitT/TauT family transport system permease protein